MFFLLMAVWFVLNGRITIEIGLVGLLVCGVIWMLACRALGHSVRRELAAVRLLPAVLVLVPRLVWEVLRANLHVMAYILGLRRGRRQPKLVVLDHGLRGEGTRLALATAITLTPGTVTAGLGRDGRLRVCAMDQALAKGLEDFSVCKDLRRMERGKEHG